MTPHIRRGSVRPSKEPPACRLIDKAVEQYRQNPESFQPQAFEERYDASDLESREAFAEELGRAIRLEALFAQSRSGKRAHLEEGQRKEEQAP